MSLFSETATGRALELGAPQGSLVGAALIKEVHV